MENYVINTKRSPLSGIDTSFSHYVEKRQEVVGKHMKGSVPDYAFALDYELRRKLDQIPHFYSISRKICATIETRQLQIYNQQAVAVGPAQYPEIYQMGIDCAHKLGIGVPNIFIYSSSQMNAFTYASDNTSPMIVLYTGIIDRLTPGELKCVIAHECGHIHNQHSVYKNVIQTLLNSGSGTLGFFLSTANLALMQFWTRAGEITADRAAMLCAEDTRDAINVQAKLLSGGIINKEFQQEINIDALRAQLDMTLENPTRMLEITSDHPSGVRRIFASKEFEECELFYEWRPELKKPGVIMRTKEETDERCKKLVNIMKNR